MCGIAGIIGNNPQGLLVETMLQRIRHRGPDGLFYWKRPGCEFGHARLSIIDLSHEADQPMVDQATGNVLIFNGEIYNYRELKSAIGNRYNFKTSSDTEVILAVYAVYGVAGINMLRGMFAFAIYDAQEGKTLIVRDRFGIKPLYYRKFNGMFLFASEIKSLVNLVVSREQINELKVYEFLGNCQMDTDNQTLFKDVFQLSPATYCWVDRNGTMGEEHEYWTFPEPGRKRFEKKDANEFVQLFHETIRLHLRSDVPVGSFVSGGIDSSSVTCFALRNMETDYLHTFSAVLPYYHPENALIADVLKSSDRITPHEFLLNGENFFEDIPSVIYHHDEPTMDGSMYAHYKLCQLAKQNGIKVLLSGSGGDELFGGYASHIHAHHGKLIGELRLIKYLGELNKVRQNSPISYQTLLFKSIYENIPISIRRRLKNRQIQQRIDHLSVKPEVQHYYHTAPDVYHANLINNYRSWTAPPFLHYEDRNSMAFGVETRVPFFDHVLIEFILQFASDDIISGRTKSLLRDNFRCIVPDAVLNQKGKYGFPSPIDHALKHNQRGMEYFYDLYKETPLLKEAETKLLGDKFYKANGDVSIYWRTLSYIIWYNIFFTAQGAFHPNHEAKIN